ncbi:MAG: nitroreductase family protein [Nanoarchaeota archaeon]|nr:nitroreductase family protein [Nanoarchaeota archaeon]
MKVDRAIKSRKSTRKFNSKKPDWKDILECIDSMRYAPMAGGNFSLKIIIVSDLQKISQLAESAQQEFLKQAKYVLVVCSKKARTINAYEEQGKIYARQQAGAAIENFLLKIEEKKLATCWVGHFVDSQVKRVLRIPEDVDVEALLPIGYEFEKRYTRRAKVDIDRILYFEEYDKNKMIEPKKLRT